MSVPMQVAQDMYILVWVHLHIILEKTSTNDMTE